MFWKRFLIVAFSLLFVIAGFAIFLNYRWKPFLTQQIKEAVSSSTDSLYTINFDDVRINVLTGSATFTKIDFVPDTAIYAKMDSQGTAPQHLFSVKVARLDLNRLHPFKVYFGRELQLASLIIQQPEVKMIYQNSSRKQDTTTDSRNAYQKLKKYLRSIRVDDIIFRDADFEYIDKSARQNQITGLKNLNIQIAGLLIDSASQFNRGKFYYTDNISVHLKNYTWRPQNGLYDIKLGDLRASVRDRSASFKDLQLIPRFAEMNFAEQRSVRTARYACRFNEISLEGIDFKAFNTNRRLIARKLTVTNSNTVIFVNKSKPAKSKNRINSFPQIALREFNLETRMDSIAIRNARVVYAEYSPISKRRGRVYFDRINGTILNVTNDEASLLKNDRCQINLTSLLMSRGRVNLDLTFDLRDSRAAFTCTGNLGNMNPTILNQIIRPLALIEIRNGFVENMQFSLKGNTQRVSGSMLVKYNNLKINLLSKNEGNPRLKKMGVASMAANILVLKNENPSSGERLRTATLNYSRPDSASFVNTIWKTLQGGIETSIGLDPATQRKIDLKIRELKVEKEDRAERREERLKRREQRKNGGGK